MDGKTLARGNGSIHFRRQLSAIIAGGAGRQYVYAVLVMLVAMRRP